MDIPRSASPQTRYDGQDASDRHGPHPYSSASQHGQRDDFQSLGPGMASYSSRRVSLLPHERPPTGASDQVPNSLVNFVASFQRSNYFIADALESTSPGTLAATAAQYQQGSIADRPRLDRIDSDWQGETSFEQDYEDSRSSILRPFEEDGEEEEAYIYHYSTHADEDRTLRHERSGNLSGGLERIDENKPLLRKASRVSRMDQDYIVGGSTIYQTVFNSVNILMGIGILSLPLGFAYAGWLIGALLFAASGAVTLYTALLLSRCMADRPELQTYADVAYAAFGTRARYYVSLAFSMELLASCTALVVLFGDGLHSLMPTISATQFKIFGFFLFFGSSFVPLSILSISSIVGILATSSVVFVVIADGFIKHTAPGSLLMPAHTDWLPQHLGRLPLAIGLMMSPWSAHSVFCNVYKDMRHPHKFAKAIKTSYGITSVLDLAMAVSGYLMFGNRVMDEITQSILGTEGYPQLISYLIVVMISIVPLTKMPLNTRPIATTVDVLLGVDERVIVAHAAGSSALTRSSLRILVRLLVNGIPVLLGIYCPSFDRVMSLLGSGLCYTICILLPVAFYLRLCGHKIQAGERMLLYSIWSTALVLGLLGTVWTFLPRELIDGL